MINFETKSQFSTTDTEETSLKVVNQNSERGMPNDITTKLTQSHHLDKNI